MTMGSTAARTELAKKAEAANAVEMEAQDFMLMLMLVSLEVDAGRSVEISARAGSTSTFL